VGVGKYCFAVFFKRGTHEVNADVNQPKGWLFW
jgi:hypothetical protein